MTGAGQKKNRMGCTWLAIGTVAVAVLTHVLLSVLPNRDDAAVDDIQKAGGEVRRTPRLLWLSTMADADFYPYGDVWDVELTGAEIDEGLAAQISGLHSLYDLRLYRCLVPIEMTGIIIPTSDHLQGIHISDTAAGDRHIESISTCRNLIFLTLDGTAVTDASVPVIVRCRNLGCLVLRRNKMTPEGIAAIRTALPATNVIAE